MTKDIVIASAVLVTIFVSRPVLAEVETDASYCAKTIETGTTVRDRPICDVVHHLQMARNELEGHCHVKQVRLLKHRMSLFYAAAVAAI